MEHTDGVSLAASGTHPAPNRDLLGLTIGGATTQRALDAGSEAQQPLTCRGISGLGPDRTRVNRALQEYPGARNRK